MCGVIGYIGDNDAPQKVYEGLKKLEYRGYDSCGISAPQNGKHALIRRVGPPSELVRCPRSEGKVQLDSTLAIGHTRWATHGKVTEANAHPHVSYCGKISIVHNGVIENAEELKNFLIKDRGIEFKSETDTEVLCNLIAYYKKSAHYRSVYGKMTLLEAVRKALQTVEGTYGILVSSINEPNKIIAAKRSSPLIMGVGEEEIYFVSDTNALPPNIDKVVYLEDNQVVECEGTSWKVYNVATWLPLEVKFDKLSSVRADAELGDYSCFMEKEIFEQSSSVRNAMRGRIEDDLSNAKFGGIDTDNRAIDNILLLGCGTAYYAGLLGKYYLENIAKIPTSVEFSSEFKYKNNPVNKNTLVIGITQSGETIDTLGALQEARNKGLDTVAITNSVASTIARETGEGIYQYAGPEVSVASTKAFTSQATILLMLSVLLGRKKEMSLVDARDIMLNIRALPELIDKTIKLSNDKVKTLADSCVDLNNINIIGRQYMYPVALEGALKIKELCYVPSHGYAAGEIKHGPLAAIGEGSVCFFLATQKTLRDKNISNLMELKSRGCTLAVIKEEGQQFPQECYDWEINMPKSKEYISPILSVIPLQLFSMYLAQKKAYNVDRPRHLAKSVTVE
tara:strand:+ start:167 stop:2032 length:1866 start_codon:yes stop_codon:yes gene_type:complete